ncbi:MAG: AbrB/MazE/SpoVT family DNA-binding domain-containing protein [Gammaproteobacteria bacterium]|nr:AbrB/MazE/SpoVT family DNA-binding domain-containing protein [Gammaproteobacteria bacterium]
MQTSNLTSKGQVTLPASIRKQLNLKTGDRIVFTLQDNKIIAEPLCNDISSLFGIIKSDKAVSLNEIEEAIAQVMLK